MKKIKAAAKAVFIYLLLTIGLWMFLNSYTNSYNRLSQEKIAPASLVLSGSKASVEVLDRSFELDLESIAPASKLYCPAYLFSPDELRLSVYLISRCYKT